jgi:hypothetical protein
MGPSLSTHEVNQPAAGAAPFHVRRANHGDPADREVTLAILREYFATVPGGENAEARYRWLYLDNPAGLARTYLALTKQGDCGT